jgi:hypothetical protein
LFPLVDEATAENRSRFIWPRHSNCGSATILRVDRDAFDDLMFAAGTVRSTGIVRG